MKLWKKNLLLILLALAICVIPLAVVKGEYGGSDDQAESVITEIKPDYKPWASSIFEPPSGEIESLLFCLQAAIGGGIIGFGFGKLSERYKASEKK